MSPPHHRQLLPQNTETYDSRTHPLDPPHIPGGWRPDRVLPQGTDSVHFTLADAFAYSGSRIVPTHCCPQLGGPGPPEQTRGSQQAVPLPALPPATGASCPEPMSVPLPFPCQHVAGCLLLSFRDPERIRQVGP